MAQWLHRGRRDRYGGNGRLVVRPELLTVSSRLAKLRKSIKIMTLWRLYSYETLLEGLAQDFQDVAAELGEFIQKEIPVVRQGHLSWQWHLAAPDQPHIGDRVMRGAKRASGDDRGAGASETGDAVNARGLQRFGQTHGQ
jgi:hypothetical protein